MSDYYDFLARKAVTSPSAGFDPGDSVSDVLFPHQRDIVRWCCKGGRRAIFAAFGLGKSLMQLEILRLVMEHEGGGKHLIVCPLGVRQEFRRDAQLLGIAPQFVRATADLVGDGIYLTNYESVRDGRLDVSGFTSVSLDEASVLRSYGSKTYQTFIDLLDGIPYRFVATATPSPNRYKELIHYAGFLGVMDTGQALTRFFQRDSTKANNLTLYPHKEREFWLWLSTWAVFVQRPSDLGYSDEGYELPPLEVVWHRVPMPEGAALPEDRDGQVRLVRDSGLSLSEASAIKRQTMEARIARAAEIVAASPGDHFILWHDLEDERREIKRQIPGAVEVYGSQDLDEREDRVVRFSDGEFPILATKPILSGSGCNFQRHCHREVFCGVGFKFNDFIQAIHRVQRFQQAEPVRIDIIYAEGEEGVVEVLKEKWRAHDELAERMAEIIREYGLAEADAAQAMRRSMGCERREESGEAWRVVNNDTVEETAAMADGSVDLIVTSIPFSNHYEYTPSYNDFGHTSGNGEFFEQMDFLTPELLRVLKPGRIYACHVKDRILFGNVTGAGLPTVDPFHAQVIAHCMGHGFDFCGMVTVVTDVVRENNQTYRLGWTEQCKDGTKMGVGCPEYVLLFHKPQTDRTRGYADVPVAKGKDEYSLGRWQTDAHAFWRSSGERLLAPEDFDGLGMSERCRLFAEFTASHVYDHEWHVSLADALAASGQLPTSFMALAPASWSPAVWTDVARMRTLNTEQSRKRQQNHVCPLQFDIVDRLIERYSNPGETVYDPFGGLMTVPLRAVEAGRRGMGTELNPQYFADGVAYLRAHDERAAMPTLFDLDELEVA